MLEVTRHTLAVRHPSCIERRLTPPLLISNLKAPGQTGSMSRRECQIALVAGRLRNVGTKRPSK